MGHGAVPVFQIQGHIFLELGSGQKRAEDKGGGEKEDRKGVPALISLQRSGKPGWDGGGGGEKGNIGTRSRQERGVY